MSELHPTPICKECQVNSQRGAYCRSAADRGSPRLGRAPEPENRGGVLAFVCCLGELLVCLWSVGLCRTSPLLRSKTQNRKTKTPPASASNPTNPYILQYTIRLRLSSLSACPQPPHDALTQVQPTHKTSYPKEGETPDFTESQHLRPAAWFA